MDCEALFPSYTVYNIICHSFCLSFLKDPDSIYTPQMSRTDRYQAYRASIDERVESAKNPQVISVLKAMKAFVVSFE
jgi:hypothetical protein